jgi:hypothetical protein
MQNTSIQNKKVTIYVIKLKGDQLSNSAPCCKCAEAMQMFGIVKKIIYSDENGNLVSVRMRDYQSNYTSLGDRCCFK